MEWKELGRKGIKTMLAIFLVSSLAGCGNSSDKDDTKKDDEVVEKKEDEANYLTEEEVVALMEEPINAKKLENNGHFSVSWEKGMPSQEVLDELGLDTVYLYEVYRNHNDKTIYTTLYQNFQTYYKNVELNDGWKCASTEEELKIGKYFIEGPDGERDEYSFGVEYYLVDVTDYKLEEDGSVMKMNKYYEGKETVGNKVKTLSVIERICNEKGWKVLE